MKPAEHPALHARLELDGARSSADRWKGPLAGIALALLGVLFCYRYAALSMVHTWEHNGTYAHGFVVLPISAWLIWRDRSSLATLPIRPFLPGIGLIALASLGWLVGKLATIQSLQEFALVVSFPLVVWTLVGTRVARPIAVPLALILFAWPAGEFLIPQLVDWTADFTVMALRLIGVPVFQQGNSFVIPTGSWSVVDVCSGIRYLIASVFGGTVFAYLTFRSTRRRLIMFAVSVIVPIFANWLRAFLVVLTGHLSENRIATGIDHIIYGWVFFGLVITAVFYIGSRFSDIDDNPPAASGATAPPRGSDPNARQFVWPVLAIVLAAALGPMTAWALDQREAARPTDIVLAIPDVAAWRSVDDPITTWSPPFKKPTASMHRRFVRDQQPVGLYVGYYRHQKAGGKLLTFASTTLVDYGVSWRALDRRILRSPAGPGSHDVIEKHMHSDSQSLLVWEWYWVGGSSEVDVLHAKFAQVRNVLAGGGDDSAAVLIYTPFTDDKAAARQRLAAFLASVQPVIDADFARVATR